MAHESGLEGGERLKIELRSMSKKWAPQRVSAGIFDSELASIGFFNEYGFLNVRHHVFVSPRPFMRLTVNDSLFLWKSTLSNMIKKGASSKEALEKVGELMEKNIKTHISTGDLYIPNTEFTEKKKGFNRPLIETGSMYHAVRYKVRRPK